MSSMFYNKQTYFFVGGGHYKMNSLERRLKWKQPKLYKLCFLMKSNTRDKVVVELSRERVF